jgi:two-component system sensor histidine kinase PilS (NtrC family)
LERTLRRTAEQTDSSQLDNRLIWLMVLRVIVVTTLLGSAVTVEVVPQPESQARPLFYLIAFTYLLTLAYALAWPFTASFRRLTAYVQIFGDLLIITGTVYFTGGLENNFSLLYFISIISASIILFRAGGLIAAATASVCYAVVILTVLFGVFPIYPPAAVPSQAVEVYYYSIFFNVFGFFTVASLTSYLSEGLRKTGRELEEASDHLADLQAFNQTVIDSIASGLMTTDLEGKINFLNKSAVSILGVNSQDVVGERVNKILGEGDDYIEYLQEMLSEQRYRRMEGMYLNRRGEQIFLGMSVSYLLSKGEELSGFLFTFQDLTEIKRLEREVRMKEKLATMGEMAAGMAHEIRNPLASISGSVQVLKESLGLEGGDSRLMNIIIRESERLSGILNDFLVYARPPRFKPDDIDLREVVEETAALLRNSAEVETDHEIALKMPHEPVQLFADPNQMKQIAWNLARNAIKAMPGGGRLEVELSNADGDEVVLAFRDEGVGIGDGEVHEIFTPFKGGFQQGSGLGLAVVYRMVQDYNGSIRVDSLSPRGTEISVHFPIDRRTIG